MNLEIPDSFTVRHIEVVTEHARYSIGLVESPSIGAGFLLAVREPVGVQPLVHFGPYRPIDARRVAPDGENEPRFETLEAALAAAEKHSAALGIGPENVDADGREVTT